MTKAAFIEYLVVSFPFIWIIYMFHHCCRCLCVQLIPDHFLSLSWTM
jgi:hypothetical protein